MTQKNPFEIRAEVLQLAKDYLDQQYHMNVNFMQKAFEENRKTFEEYQTAVNKMYTVDELTKKAQEMYSFISTKEKKE
jgi:hypothetical protein